MVLSFAGFTISEGFTWLIRFSCVDMIFILVMIVKLDILLLFYSNSKYRIIIKKYDVNFIKMTSKTEFLLQRFFLKVLKINFN